MIEEILFKSKPYYEDEKRELKQLYNHYQQRFQYTGVGDVVEGYVYDETSGESLPGVSVIIKGTSYGTVTDAAGYYSIKVPSGNNSLNFSFIGYVSEDKPLGYDGVLNVKLSADMSNIEEVVVVGFSSQKQSYLVGSAYTVTSSRTLGGIPGVSGNISESLQGQVSGISISSNNEAPGSAVEFHIRGASSIKFEQAPLYIINGNVFTGDISELDPATIQGMQVLKDASATSIYGARAVNGVVIIETQPGAFKAASPMSKGADYDDAFLEAAAQAGSIRDNFSDYAFWEPSLVTDENGKASFEVTFPDDVTRWETFYFAMNGKRQSGQSKGSIKSYKPLMAQLAVPRFLVENDTSYAIGKVLNYTSDSIRVETRFEVDGQEMQNTSRFCNNSLIDTLPFFASTDSVELKYFIETEDNYFDGEQRKIPVFPQGLEVTKGDFYVLDKDTTIQLKCDSALGTVSLYARADILHVLDDEISYLIKYKYSCNEQLASKLKALLAEKNIAHYRGERFKNDNEIEKLIRLLKRNQNGNGLWGWWKVSKESLWISLHVLEALIHAEQLGYRSLVNKNKIAKLLIWELENSRYFNDKVRILKILNLLGTPINNQFYISNLERENKPSLNSLLSIIELKQLCGMDYDLDTLKHYEKSSMFGNIYYSDKKQETNLLNNDMQNTILAYKIFRSDSIVDAERLNKIQNYFLENRRNGYWRNTYESAQVIETILSDLLNRQLKAGKCQLTLTGSVDRVVSEFPFTMNVNSTANIEVSKTGGAPIYFTSYQKYWNNKPSLKMEDFEISTYFDDKQSSSLSVGKETKLIAKVIVKKDAEYVMINIPIPGACSYAHKRNNFRNESHREYFKNETTIFCDYLPKGEYTFEIALLPRYLGTFTINPAKIEMMYFPTFNANNEIKTIKIIEAE